LNFRRIRHHDAVLGLARVQFQALGVILDGEHLVDSPTFGERRAGGVITLERAAGMWHRRFGGADQPGSDTGVTDAADRQSQRLRYPPVAKLFRFQSTDFRKQCRIVNAGIAGVSDLVGVGLADVGRGH
jgi:hypothetical protein